MSRFGLRARSGVVAQPTGDAYAGLNANTLSNALRVQGEFDGTWEGNQGEAFMPGYDVLCTSAADFNSQWATLMGQLRAGTAERSWHYRFKLDSNQPSSAWTGVLNCDGATNAQWTWVTGTYFDGPCDLATYGGVIVVESSDVNNQVVLTGGVGINGFRGIHFRNVKHGRVAPTTTSGGSTLAISIASNSTRREACVVRIENCAFGLAFHPTQTDMRYAANSIRHTGGAMEQLDVINCNFDGFGVAIATVGVRRMRLHYNDFQRQLADVMANYHSSRVRDANTAWDERVIRWNRGNTVRNTYDAEYLSGLHCDANQTGTSGDIGDYDVLNEFECYYGERVTGTDNTQLPFSANPTDGVSITLDGVTLTWRETPTQPTDLAIGANIDASLAPVQAYFTANPTANLVWINATSGYVEAAWSYHNKGTFTTTGSASSQTFRVAGATHGVYMDDLSSSYAISAVTHNCFLIASDGIALRMYNGTAYSDRVLCARPGQQPADPTMALDGYSSTYAFKPYVTSGRKHVSAAAYHYLYSSITGYLYDSPANAGYTSDGVYAVTANRSFTAQGNVYVEWAPGSTAPSTKFAGPFYFDGQNRNAYTSLDVPGDTPAQFRQRVYDQFKLADLAQRPNRGPTDPAIWPMTA